MVVLDSIEAEDDAFLTMSRKVQDRCLLYQGTMICTTDNTQQQQIHDDVTAQYDQRQRSLTRLT